MNSAAAQFLVAEQGHDRRNPDLEIACLDEHQLAFGVKVDCASHHGARLAIGSGSSPYHGDAPEKPLQLAHMFRDQLMQLGLGQVFRRIAQITEMIKRQHWQPLKILVEAHNA